MGKNIHTNDCEQSSLSLNKSALLYKSRDQYKFS